MSNIHSYISSKHVHEARTDCDEISHYTYYYAAVSVLYLLTRGRHSLKIFLSLSLSETL